MMNEIATYAVHAKQQQVVRAALVTAANDGAVQLVGIAGVTHFSTRSWTGQQ
jgi:hypothetical protein